MQPLRHFSRQSASRRATRFAAAALPRPLTLLVAAAVSCSLWPLCQDALSFVRAQQEPTPRGEVTRHAWEAGRFARTVSFFKGNPLKLFLPGFLQWKDNQVRPQGLKGSENDAIIIDWGDSDGMPVAQAWGPLDDVVMGGVSSSRLAVESSTDGRKLVYSGRTSRENNGGFCSFRSKLFQPALNLSGYDGLVFRARCPDGLRYKFQMRDNTGWDSPGWAVGFDTVAGKDVEVRIPFNTLVPNFRTMTMTQAPPLEKSNICSMQLMLSAFEFDKKMNPRFKEGEFRLELGPIRAYKR